MDLGITHMSSKGQIVIPAHLREGFNEGDKLLIIENNNQIIIKKTDDLEENFKKEFELARRTKELWEQIKKNKNNPPIFNKTLKKLYNLK